MFFEKMSKEYTLADFTDIFDYSTGWFSDSSICKRTDTPMTLAEIYNYEGMDFSLGRKRVGF